MQGQIATGFLPYEIGDEILLNNSTIIYTIEDIKMIQYIKIPKVEFEVEVISNHNTMPRWISSKLILKRV